MNEAKHVTRQPKTMPAEEVQVFAEEQTASSTAKYPTEPLSIPWHVLFPPGHPMHTASRT
jgi:hypothetical protein